MDQTSVGTFPQRAAVGVASHSARAALPLMRRTNRSGGLPIALVETLLQICTRPTGVSTNCSVAPYAACG